MPCDGRHRRLNRRIALHRIDDARKGMRLELGRSLATRCRWRSSAWAACSPRRTTSLGSGPTSATGVDAITDVPDTHWRPEDYFDPDPKAPDRTYARRGRVPRPRSISRRSISGSPPTTSKPPTPPSCSACWSPARPSTTPATATDRDFDRDRVSVILGVTGTLELVIPLGARLGHPIWRRALQGRRRRRRPRPTTSSSGSPTPTSAGRRTRSPACWATSPPAGSPTASTWAAPTAWSTPPAPARSAPSNLALLELAAGRCDMADPGGLDTFNDIFMYMCFSKTPALSPTGDARPFDAGGRRHDPGRGAGRRGAQAAGRRAARRRPDLRGDPVGGDVERRQGPGGLRPERGRAGQGAAAGVRAGRVSPATIELVEAHGTGTKVGDATELAALERGLPRSAGPAGRWCALGSVKSQIGHTKAAAGAAGLIKAALALHHKVLPPTIKVNEPMEPLGDRHDRRSTSTPSPALAARAGPSAPAPRSAPSASAAATSIACSRRPSPEMPGIDWDGDVQILAFSGDEPDRLRASLPPVEGEIDWTELRGEGTRSRACSARRIATGSSWSPGAGRPIR